MDKYKRLLSNTVIFAVGAFSSKVLTFLLMPYYTHVLSPGELGIGDLVSQTANLLVPLMSLGIANAIIRFGLDKSYRKDDVLSTGLIVVLCGYLAMLPFAPLIQLIPDVGGYTLLIYVYMLTSILRSLLSQFVRARGLVRLYALDGILSTLMTILFNILFLTVFKLGVAGYVLATICADACSSLFLFLVAGLRQFVKFQNINKRTAISMLKYAAPLIPNMVCWWVTNSSDKFVVNAFLGAEQTGFLTAAYKLPSIITIVSTIFLDAWQISAITEQKGRAQFFSKVFRSYSAIVFMGASGLILCSRWIMTFFVSKAYYDAWRYIPFLVMATAFSCLVTFIGSVYTVEKKSFFSMVTMISGAVLNLLLDILLTPIWGVNGAAVATFLGYLTVFVMRAVHSRKYIRFQLGVPRLCFNTLVLGAQSMLLICEVPYWLYYEIGLCLLVLVVNGKAIWESVSKLLGRRFSR